MPASHRYFLGRLETALDLGRWFLCHAGIRPGVPFARQTEQDLLWIREGFIDSAADFGKIVVHGHTPAAEPEILTNRINVDTGAFATGVLCCAVLEEAHTRFIRVNPHGVLA
jgi:serine/threonine protein phosphatase 1